MVKNAANILNMHHHSYRMFLNKLCWTSFEKHLLIEFNEIWCDWVSVLALPVLPTNSLKKIKRNISTKTRLV